MARLLYRVGVPDARANLAGLPQRHRRDARPAPADDAGRGGRAHLLRDLLDLAVKYRIRIPQGVRAAVAARRSPWRACCGSSRPDLNILEVALPYAKELLAGRYDPAAAAGRADAHAAALPGAGGGPARRSCRRSSWTWRPGKFSVHVRARAVRQGEREPARAAVIAFLGLCACGFIVGAFISFSQVPWTVRGVPGAGARWARPAAAALFGAAFTWYLFGNRFGKISLRRFLPSKGRSAR